MGVVIVLLMLLSALLLSWACTARPLLEQQPRGAVSLAVRATGGQIHGRVMNTTQEPLLYTPLYLERYSVWSRRWDVVRRAPAPLLRRGSLPENMLTSIWSMMMSGCLSRGTTGCVWALCRGRPGPSWTR